MSASSRVRLRLHGTLRAETGLHVGGGRATAEADLALAEDGQGRLYIPGTSLAGALRAWTATRLDAAQTAALWGEAVDGDGSASQVWVADGLVLSDGPRPVIRDGVGIDRWTGAAATRVKYTQAVLPRGTRIDLDLDVPESASAWLGALVAALQAAGIPLGAGRGGGLGRARLEGPLEVWRTDRGTRAGMIETLRDGGQRVAIEGLGTLPDPAAATLAAEVAWSSELPLLVGAGRGGLGIDALPLTTPVGDGMVAFLLPGRSWKGALRAHAERVIRTIVDGPNPRALEFAQQVDVPLVRALFGSPQRRGALQCRDCCSLARIPADLWRQIEDAGSLREAEAHLRRVAGLAAVFPAMHVAIDRWTGGAADHRLYSALELHGVAWEPLRLDCDTAWLTEPREAALALLFLLLQDLGEGRIALGGGATRGHGAVRASRITVTGHGLSGLADPLGWAPDAGLPPGLRDALGPAWAAWCATGGGGA